MKKEVPIKILWKKVIAQLDNGKRLLCTTLFLYEYSEMVFLDYHFHTFPLPPEDLLLEDAVNTSDKFSEYPKWQLEYLRRYREHIPEELQRKVEEQLALDSL